MAKSKSPWKKSKYCDTYSLDFENLPDMAKLLEEKSGDALEIRKFTVDEKEANRCRMLSTISQSMRGYYDFKAGTYVKLQRKGDNSSDGVIMSNTPMEIRTNSHYMHMANGHVLQAGLGIGMTAMILQSKPTVKSITVVEISKEVIGLVGKQLSLNGKINIFNADIFEWMPEHGKLYDTIYFDIWDTISSDNWEEMKKLRRKFAKRLNRSNPDSYIGCWESASCNPRNPLWRGW